MGIILHKPSNRKKKEIGFVYENYVTSGPYNKKKTYTENEKSGANHLFLILSPKFWYASILCSTNTDWALLLRKKLNFGKLKAEKKSPQNLD